MDKLMRHGCVHLPLAAQTIMADDNLHFIWCIQKVIDLRFVVLKCISGSAWSTYPLSWQETSSNVASLST